MNLNRLRTLGFALGTLPTGPRNLITDVPGVTVGHCTVDTDRQKTGVTAIIPAEGNLYARPLVAAVHVINGFGKTAGLMQVQELGLLETPILLTGTLNVGRVSDALVSEILEQCARDGIPCRTVNPVVGETNDGTLSCHHDRPVGLAEVQAAIRSASADFAEGDVGAGKGTVCHGLKGGIGSASRVMEIYESEACPCRRFTLGVLVQTNYGCIEELRLDGLPVGRAVLELLRRERESAASAEGQAPVLVEGQTPVPVPVPVEGQDDIGSIMIVVGTDLPVTDRQLTRILRRATVGLARMGSHIGHGSGDVVLGFTTANRLEPGAEAIRHTEVLREDRLEIAFRAVAECVEEAIADSLLCADCVTGFNGTDVVTVRALGEFLPEALEIARGMAARGMATRGTAARPAALNP